MADIKITGAVGYGGRVYREGDEDAFLADTKDADIDYDRLKEQGAVEGGSPDSDGKSESIFASPAAEQLANDEGLTEDDFDGVEPSGATGYTKSDVEKVASEKEG